MEKRLQTYIQENTPLLQQRHGLVTMLSMASQTKDKDGNYLIASEVTAIAEFLIIMDLERMPQKSQLAQALPEYKRDDISTEQMKSLLVLLTADSLEVPKSPAKLVTKNSPPKSLTRGLRESASDTESDEDTQRMSRTQPVVTVKGPTYVEAKALLSQLRLQTVTQRPKVSEQLNEEELQRRLIERFHKLDCGHISALSEYYIAHHFAMIGDADVLDQLMNKQARAATTIMNCVDPKFQKELRVSADGWYNRCCENGQFTRFIVCEISFNDFLWS